MGGGVDSCDWEVVVEAEGGWGPRCLVGVGAC